MKLMDFGIGYFVHYLEHVQNKGNEQWKWSGLNKSI